MTSGASIHGMTRTAHTIRSTRGGTADYSIRRTDVCVRLKRHAAPICRGPGYISNETAPTSNQHSDSDGTSIARARATMRTLLRMTEDTSSGYMRWRSLSADAERPAVSLPGTRSTGPLD